MNDVTEYNRGDQILPLLQALYLRDPTYRHARPNEAQALLWTLGYTEGVLPEEEIEAAMTVRRALDSQGLAA